MRAVLLRPLAVGAILGTALLGAPGSPAGASPEEPALKSILYSTGGVALFEYEAPVKGAGTLSLTVRLDQVADVLRSLSVSDPAGAPAYARLAVRSPVDERFRDLPFNRQDLASLPRLLEALKGARVSVSGPSSIEGQIVSVSQELTPVPGTDEVIVRHRLGVWSEKGMGQVLVEDIRTLNFLDESVRKAVDDALAALESAREKDTRTLTITLAKGETRTVRLAHVAEVPLWKSSYRLTLPSEAQATAPDRRTARLAGWATLENLSGQDWTDVRLTLLSGNPVTFRQDLYSPYHVARPTVPVEVYGRVLPMADEGAFASADSAPLIGAEAEEFGARKQALAAPRPAVASAGMMRDRDSVSGAGAFLAADGFGTPDLLATDVTEVTAQVLFTLPGPITLASGQSLLAPLVDEAVPATRVVHVVLADGVLRPMAAVRLENGTQSALPPGPVSLFQEGPGGLAYLGDARLGVFPKGETRLLDFAVDNDITVITEARPTQQTGGLSASGGTLRVKSVERIVTTYRLRSAADVPRTVVLDVPKIPGWTFNAPDGIQATEDTASSHRLTLVLEPEKEVALPVTMERATFESMGTHQLDIDTLARLSSDGALSDAEKAAMKTLTEAASKAVGARDELERIASDLAEISSTQEDIRDNLGAVPKGSDLQKHFLARMGELETRRTDLEKKRDAAKKVETDARNALEGLIRTLDLP